MKNYINATEEAGREFYLRQIKGEVTMLNLLKFNAVADYGSNPEFNVNKAISGETAFELYMKHTLPFLKEAGGEIIFYGKGGSFLIGPSAEKWDAILLVKHQNVSVFLDFAQNTQYLEGIVHRTAALLDSRLLPMEEMENKF